MVGHGELEGTRLGPSTGFAVPEFLQGTIGRFTQRRVTAVITVITVLIAALMRWTQDDAFITLRYARNLALGRGLVYNVGEYVEGYTNFLWTVLMSVPGHLGIDPVGFGHLLSLAAMVVTVVATVRLATACLGSEVLGNVAGLVLVGDFTFIAYGTGGLETQLQTALVTSALLIVVGAHVRGVQVSTRGLVAAGVLSAAAVLTRMDSVVLLSPAIGLLVLDEVRRGRPGSEVLARLTALAGPMLILLVPWTVWRYATYGSLLPNTAVAKHQGLVVSVLQAASYLTLFLLASGLAVLVPALFIRGRYVLRQRPMPLVAATLVAWLAYLCMVGSDFMEFRFMVAALPMISILATALLVSIRSHRWQLTVVAVLILALPVHAIGFRGVANVDPVGHLHAYVSDPDRGWLRLGELLGESLGGGPEAEEPGSGAPVLAVTAAGALPYEARLRTVDMLGLTDSWVAVNGIDVPARTLLPKPGHTRVASPEYLADKGVTLVLGHPQVLEPLSAGESYGADFVEDLFYGTPIDMNEFPPDAAVVEMPLPTDNGRQGEVLAMIYLTSNPVVDQLVKSGVWRKVPLGT